MNKLEFNDIIKIENNKKIRKDNVKLYLDCVYCNNKPYKNLSDLVLSTLMGVGTMGGFRPIGSYKDSFDIKYVVLYSTHEDIYWQDKLDEELGIFTYYGDNQESGRELHDTKLGGNKILREVYSCSQSDDINVRKKIPPFFLFEKVEGGDVRFSGLLVPGYRGIPQKEWLTAVWAKRKEGGRFQNYKAIFTVLDTSEGSAENPNDASIDLKWLEDLKKGKGYESQFAPKVWKKYIQTGKFTPLIVNVESEIRSKSEQLPTENLKLKMLNQIYEYFKDTPTDFEQFAIYITTLADSHIIYCENTRPSKDGGRDGIGEYKIMDSLSTRLKTSFALEAKCYELDNSVGVKETSRLISRIKNRQFGVFVTTSYVANQAYEEIIEDGHPIAIIAGKDIIDILFNNDITDLAQLDNLLTTNFPKEQ